MRDRAIVNPNVHTTDRDFSPLLYISKIGIWQAFFPLGELHPFLKEILGQDLTKIHKLAGKIPYDIIDEGFKIKTKWSLKHGADLRVEPHGDEKQIDIYCLSTGENEHDLKLEGAMIGSKARDLSYKGPGDFTLPKGWGERVECIYRKNYSLVSIQAVREWMEQNKKVVANV